MSEHDCTGGGPARSNVPSPDLNIPKERRTASRIQVDDSAIIRLINLALDVPGRIVDVSMGGCRIRTERKFPVGICRRVETEFRIEGLPFRIAGVTQAIHDPFNVGVRFLDMSERKREQLLQLIEEIEAKPSACSGADPSVS